MLKNFKLWDINEFTNKTAFSEVFKGENRVGYLSQY